MNLPTGTGALITDPGLVAVLDTVLTQPVHLEPPALRHFLDSSKAKPTSESAPIARASRAPSGGGAGGLAVVPAALVTALVTGLALTVLAVAGAPLLLPLMVRRRAWQRPLRRGGGVGGWRLRSVPRRWASAGRAVRLPRVRTGSAGLVAAGAVGVVVVTAAMVVAGRGPAAVPSPRNLPVAAGSHAAARAGRTASATPAPAARVSTSWSQLVEIEQTVAARQQQLALEEDRIANLADSSAGHVEPPMRGSGSDLRSAAAAALVALLQAHQQTVSAYQESLQHEYDFYVAASQDATVRAAVTEAASASGAAGAVVTYDLQQVSTQLQQEQAIAAAQAAAARAAAAQAQQQIAANVAAPKFSAPLGGYVSQGFGPSSLALEPSITYHGVFYTHFHTGIDIANTLDTPVVATAPGRVILSGSSRDASGNLVGYGNYVVIDHGAGFITLYGHLDKLVATTGQLVQRGQEIGLLGSTGWSTGPHVHFEIRHGGELVDPETFLGAAVRA